MTPKEQYEARKAERDKRRKAEQVLRGHDKDAAMEDLFDRLVTAFERIADAMQQKSVNS